MNENYIEETLKKRIENIITSFDKNDKPILVVTIGMTKEQTKELSYEFLFNFNSPGLKERHDSQKYFIERAISKGSELKIYQCDYDDFLFVPDQVVSIYYYPIYIVNNLYSNVFPMKYGLVDELEELVKEFHFIEESENESPFLNIDQIYGSIVKFDSYYCSYSKMPERYHYLFEIDKIKVNETPLEKSVIYNITCDELFFIPFINLVLQSENIEFKIIKTPELKTLGYEERLKILSYISPSTVSIVLSSSFKEDFDKTEENYGLEELLRNKWGYESFKNIQIYENIHNKETCKKLVEISQEKIISTIIDQSVLALKDESFQDIFVTAPTGSGKSLLFQAAAIYLAENYDLLTIVISPLIGLMKDQVDSLTDKRISIAATINSDISPVQKSEIQERVKSSEISLLYISPETLLSRSDISMLIGDRKVGLFVIDEAHIVTTWGKAFRSDYWYLGTYLNRLRKESSFPVVTFTATAIYGGIEDMFLETRDSLSMINPITYFGNVKRENIQVQIQNKINYMKKGNEYKHDKFKVMFQRLRRFSESGKKTLVYFPLITLINEFYEFVNRFAEQNLIKSIAFFYGSLEKDDKRKYFEGFKENRYSIMLATKAFGMGIDIPDIDIVYHFAPTGNVCDYIQEIGRAARKIPQGVACFDFFKPDFTHVKKLHGISTIRKYQLVQILIRVSEIYKKSGKNRNLLVNADDFYSIFSSGMNNDSDIDNKIKTALLIIEKDFVQKYGYSPIVARPRSLFVYEYFYIKRKENIELLGKYQKYFKKMADEWSPISTPVYRADLKSIWKEGFQRYSFAQFKYYFYQDIRKLNNVRFDVLNPLIRMQINFTNSFEITKNKVEDIGNKINYILSTYSRTSKYFTVRDLSEKLHETFSDNKKFNEYIAESLIQGFTSYSRLMRYKNNFGKSFIRFNESSQKYQIVNTSYQDYINTLFSVLEKILKSTRTQDQVNIYYLNKKVREDLLITYIALGLLEDFKLLVYRSSGGDNPEIFIRMNSQYQIERILNNPERYHNQILDNVYKRHRVSVEMLTYLFTEKNSTDEFWESIEDYFLGKIPEPVLMKI